MAKSPKKRTAQTGPEEIELHPDAWKRFEAGVRSLAKRPVPPVNAKAPRSKSKRKSLKKA